MDITLIDKYLLKKITKTPQRSPMVVAYALVAIWEEMGTGYVGDVELYKRLRELSKLGIIEISNPHT